MLELFEILALSGKTPNFRAPKDLYQRSDAPGSQIQMPPDLVPSAQYPKGRVGGQGQVENCGGCVRRIALVQDVVLESEWRVECLRQEWVVEVLNQVCGIVVLDRECRVEPLSVNWAIQLPQLVANVYKKPQRGLSVERKNT